MSLFRRVLDARGDVTTSQQLLELIVPSAHSSSGAIVTKETTLGIATAYACVRVLAEGIAQLPLVLMRLDGRVRERAVGHPLYRILHRQPNPFQTSFEFWEMMQTHVALGGEAFALKTVVRGEVRELLPISSAMVSVRRWANWKLTFDVTMPDGTTITVPEDRMLFLRGLTLDGVRGLSPIAYHRETLGLSMQLTKHGSALFRNGALIGGVLEHPNTLSPEAAKRLRDSFDEQYSGVDNAHKTILLEEGTKFSKTGMSAVDAQFVESRKLQRSEIAAIFRIPPHMIGDLDRATFSNIEQQSLEFVKYTLAPWIRRWEQRISMQLISPEHQDTYYPKFIVEGLLRGDYKTRTDGYRTGVMTGWLSRNEVRELEDMNPVDGLDEFFSPLNMAEGSRTGANTHEDSNS